MIFRMDSGILQFRIISFIYFQCNFLLMRLPSANLQYVYLVVLLQVMVTFFKLY